METVSKSFLASTVFFAGIQRKAHVGSWAEFERQQMNARIIASTNLTMSSREIADLIGKQHSNIKISAERLSESRVIGTLAAQEFTHNGNLYTEYLLCKRDSLILVAQNCPEFTAVIVDRWQELEEQVAQTPKVAIADKDKFDMSLKLVQVAMAELNLAPSGRLLLLKTVEGNFGLPPALPNYAADNNGTSTEGSTLAKSLTELLQEYGSDISVRKANKILLDMGFLKEQSRPSTSSETGFKQYKTVDGDGLKYGKNMNHPHNQRESQPLWYAETFAELLSLITAHKEAK